MKLTEEKSKIDLIKKRENEYLKEIDELKEQRRKYVCICQLQQSQVEFIV